MDLRTLVTALVMLPFVPTSDVLPRRAPALHFPGSEVVMGGESYGVSVNPSSRAERPGSSFSSRHPRFDRVPTYDTLRRKIQAFPPPGAGVLFVGRESRQT